MRSARGRSRGKFSVALGAALSVAVIGSTVALAAIITGTPGNDELRGSNQVDIINGLAGHDVIYPEGGLDSAYGDTGHDVLCQSAGSDLLNGGAGIDIITDGAEPFAPHHLVCEFTRHVGATNDADVLTGKDGNDTLISVDGDGLDVVDGGPGSDVCHIDRPDLVRLGCENVTVHP